MNGLNEAVLDVARSYLHVREKGGRNRGPEIDRFVRNVRLDPTKGHAWCAAFVYTCFLEATTGLGLLNPCPCTGGALKMLQRALPSQHVRRPVAGGIFVLDHGKGFGHVGIVERVDGISFVTIEGNTNRGGSREGDGVYRRVRSVDEVNGGFVDFGLADTRDADVA